MVTTREETVAFLSERIEQLNDRLDRIEEEKTLVTNALKYVRDGLLIPEGQVVAPECVWRLPSRSGGDDHYVTLRGKAYMQRDNWSCSCKAGENGRECWALQGVRGQIMYGPYTRDAEVFSFLDERNLRRWATRVGK